MFETFFLFQQSGDGIDLVLYDLVHFLPLAFCEFSGGSVRAAFVLSLHDLKLVSLHYALVLLFELVVLFHQALPLVSADATTVR